MKERESKQTNVGLIAVMPLVGGEWFWGYCFFGFGVVFKGWYLDKKKVNLGENIFTANFSYRMITSKIYKEL